MRKASILLGLAVFLVTLQGFECKKNISRDEIPIIKESVAALEAVLKVRNTVYLDSLLSSEAAGQGMSADSIMKFVYADGLSEFVGFTGKQIFFRGDAARIDCNITGPDGPTRDVTLTLRFENGAWLLKKIEPRIDEPLKLPPDSTAPGA